MEHGVSIVRLVAVGTFSITSATQNLGTLLILPDWHQEDSDCTHEAKVVDPSEMPRFPLNGHFPLFQIAHRLCHSWRQCSGDEC